MNNSPPKDQSSSEWLDSYAGESSVASNIRQPQKTSLQSFNHRPRNLSGKFHYIDHKTITTGRLILYFIHTETGIPVAMFFNVTLGKYPAGSHGQFSCAKLSKFRRFFYQVLGFNPASWSRAYEKLYMLKSIDFSGNAILKRGSKSNYYAITDFTAVRTKNVLNSHKIRTHPLGSKNPGRKSLGGKSDRNNKKNKQNSGSCMRQDHAVQTCDEIAPKNPSTNNLGSMEMVSIPREDIEMSVYEFMEERAGILEFVHGYDRKRAERVARSEADLYRARLAGKLT